MPRRPPLLLALFASLVALSVTGAAAQSPEQPAFGVPQRGPVRARMLGGYRVGVNLHSAYPVDAHGTDFEQPIYLAHRLRLAPEVTFVDRLTIGGELDLLTGLLGGSLPAEGVGYDERARWEVSGMQRAEVRTLFAGIHADRADLRLGLQTDHWGLGMVANDGGPAGAGFGDDPFGVDDWGDRVIRVRASLLPPYPGGVVGYLRLDLMLDLVARDEENRLVVRGDVDFGPGVRLEYVTPLARWGVWATWRTRRDAAGASADLLQVDGYLDRTLPVGRRAAELRLALELAGRAGRDQRASGWPGDAGQRQILAGAAVGEGALLLGRRMLEIGVRGGVASGDRHLDDELDTHFDIDRDYNAGLVLFDEVLAGITARDALAAMEIAGAEHPRVAEEGAIAGALFVLPYVALRPVSLLEFRVGGLVAGSIAGPVLIHPPPPQAAVLNGTAFVHGERFLGGELLASARLEVPIAPAVGSRARVGLKIEYGHLFPGPALTEGWVSPVPGVDRFAVHAGMTF